MNIVTYNMQKGGPSDMLQWSKVIDAFDPDLLFAQESCDPGKYILQPGYEDLKAKTVWRPANKNWGVAVYAKCGKLTELTLKKFPGWLSGVEIEGLAHPGEAERRLRAFSLHAPPWSVTQEELPATIKKMLKVIRENRGDADLIIGGNFNLHSLGERHQLEIKGDKPWITSREEKEILNLLRDDFKLINCWQTANPGVSLGQTLRWSNNPIPAFHCDGIFVPASWRESLRACKIASSVEWAGGDEQLARSDHNPVVVTFANQRDEHRSRQEAAYFHWLNRNKPLWDHLQDWSATEPLR